jgi:hypothetical protein
LAAPRAWRRLWSSPAATSFSTAIADELVVTKRAVERHINAIFLKLGLREDQEVSRRVKATLLFLADQA